MVIDKKLISWARTRDNLLAATEALRIILECCLEKRLRCVDPPLVSTGLIYSMGKNQYFVRNFWSDLPLGTHTVPLYRYLDTYFELEIEHVIDRTWEMECDRHVIPIDHMDHATRREGKLVPRTHLLYARIRGRIEGNRIRVNVVRLARMVEAFEPGWTTVFLDGVEKAYRDISLLEDLEERVLEEISKRKAILLFLLPKVPESIDELFRVAPVVRFLSSLAWGRRRG